MLPFTTPQLLFSTEDSLGKIRVFEDTVERFLTFDTLAKQSAVNKYDFDQLSLAYQKVMALPLCFATSYQKILMVGLGAGCLAKTVHRALPLADIEVIELRPKVLEVAQAYFDFKTDTNLKVLLDNAADLLPLWRGLKTYDWILVDAFHNEGMPAKINNIDFFQSCLDLLADGGNLTLNYWSSQYHTNPTVLEFLQKEFRQIFLFSDVEKCSNQIYFFIRNLAEVKLKSRTAVALLEKVCTVGFQKSLQRLQKRNYLTRFIFQADSKLGPASQSAQDYR